RALSGCRDDRYRGRVQVWIEADGSGGTIDSQRLAGANPAYQVRHLPRHGNPQAAGQDGGVALRPAILDNHAGQPIEVNREKVHDRGFVRHQHQFVARRTTGGSAGPQVPENAAEDILDVVNTLLKKRIGELVEGAHIFLQRLLEGPFDRAARCQTGGEV